MTRIFRRGSGAGDGVLATKAGACLLSAAAIGAVLQLRELSSTMGPVLVACAAACAVGTFVVNRGHAAGILLLLLA